VPPIRYRFARRANWSREEWILAYDACPKVRQTYGPDAPIVRELADLIGRTPAAVSLAFGNLWAAQSRGRRGLVHVSHLAQEVVEEFRDQPAKLRDTAKQLRQVRIPSSLTPRLEVSTNIAESVLPEEVVHRAAADSGLPSDFYFVTTRTGSTIVEVGVLLQALLNGTNGWPLITNTIQVIREYLRGQSARYPGPFVELRSRTWRETEAGRTTEVEEQVIRAYLPDLSTAGLSTSDKTLLVGFLAFLRGLRREDLPPTDLGLAHVVRTRGRPLSRSTLQKILGIDLTNASGASLKRLSDLVKAARTPLFAVALSKTRRRAGRRRNST
jgi:hypothetical protein